MSGRKNNLLKFQTVTNGDMSTTSITSAITNIQFLDNVGIQFNWTGSPTGTFSIQVSADYAQDNNGNVTNPGNWAPLNLSMSTTGGSPLYADLNQLSAPWIRAVYTRSAGSGTLQVFITAKMI